MLDSKVYDICAKYLRCQVCPLYCVCTVSHEEIPGDTIESKTAVWEDRMNEAAKEVEL